MPTPRNVTYFTTSGELRAWLESNHETAEELWVGYQRKRAGRPSVTWHDVVDQALCFGWIDSVRYSLDGDTFAQRLTPRRKRSVWSRVNTSRFRELREQGLVRPAGEAAFAAREEDRSGTYAYENQVHGFDEELRRAFRGERAAWDFFESQAPWYRRTATYWVMSAKREDTRARRLRMLIEHSAKRERIPPLSRTSPSPRSPSHAPRRAL